MTNHMGWDKMDEQIHTTHVLVWLSCNCKKLYYVCLNVWKYNKRYLWGGSENYIDYLNYPSESIKTMKILLKAVQTFKRSNSNQNVLKSKLITFWHISEDIFYRKHIKFVGTLIFTK